MKTPICDFVKNYAEQAPLRLHMPGHKGKGSLGVEALDITEIDGADVLYNASGIIRQSEENASLLFGSGKTLYSAEGSSLSIRAMLYLTKLYSESMGEGCVIAAARNAHKVFVTASALLGIDVDWIFPEKAQSLISCRISPEYLDGFLSSAEKKPSAVYITSPDYLGSIADIGGISRVCKKHGCLLLVDNAHGAYLGFLKESLHPITLGADVCCDSAHKTLPVITGGAYLHISKTAPAVFSEYGEKALALFASTSPSYLILQSLDMANAYISDGYTEKLEKATAMWCRIKAELLEKGYELIGNEPLKLSIATKSYGYEGSELADALQTEGIFVEFYDRDFVVMMLSPEWDSAEAEKIKTVLTRIERKAAIDEKPPVINRPKVKMSAREAIFALSERYDIHESIGRTMASATVSCPPAIPIVSCGEVIDETAVEAMEYYGISSVDVV